MKIAIVGLGLIGGSVCKALKKNTFHHIMGLDADGEVCRKALDSGAIDEIITADGLNDADMTMLCLYPETIVEFVKQHKDRFKPGSIVTDSCGVKEYVVTRCTEVLEPLGVIFVGSHPMAGREFSGFDYSTDDLFKGASYIITPSENGYRPLVNACLLYGLRQGRYRNTETARYKHSLYFTAGARCFKRLCQKPVAIQCRRFLGRQFYGSHPCRKAERIYVEQSVPLQ